MAALTDLFPAPSLEAWRAQVVADLGGAAFEQRMFTSSFEGVTLPALSTGWTGPAEGAPVPARSGPWAILQRHEGPELGVAQAQIGEDLRGGADGLILAIGPGALSIASADDLGTLLGEAALDRLSVHLSGPGAADALPHLWAHYQARGVEPGARRGGCGADPLGLLLAGHPLAGGLEGAYDRVLGLFQSPEAPHFEVLTVDTSVHHEAGASAVEELAAGLSAIVAYWRALEARGLAPAEVAPRMALQVALGPDLYLSLATLRAARLLYAELARGAGLPERLTLAATTGRRSWSRLEQANNLLRTTAATFAAAVGGADRLTTWGHDGVTGPASAMGRRYARNAQLILAHESRLAQVNDPAGGSWFFEGLTDQLAQLAWSAFQALEAQGGLAAAIQSGAWQRQVRRIGEERLLEARRRKTPLVGVSEYPDLGEPPAPAPPVAAVPPVETPEGSLRLPALLPQRLALPFEVFRARSERQLEATGKRPKVFLAVLGPPKTHGARLQFTTQLLASGGVVPVGQGPYDPGTVGPAFRESGAKLAILVGSDGSYAKDTEAVAQALKTAGAHAVLLAGRPGEHDEQWREAGVDSFLFFGCDVPELLDRLYAFIGAQA